MKISLVVSTRDNLKYLKWSYDSIRKNQGDHEVWICYGIDHCTDGTQDWIEEIKKTDPFVRSIENTTGRRLGHTIMYDRVVNEIVETDLAMIFHSDMYLCPGALDAVDGLMYHVATKEEIENDPNLKKIKEDIFKAIYDVNDEMMQEEGFDLYDMIDDLSFDVKFPIKDKNRIVSLTRIEPPLHPSGPEKIVKDFGTEPENFDEVQLVIFSNRFANEVGIHGHRVDKNLDENLCTNGVFAPWAFWVDEFKEIGGHDALFAPQSKEDSDIFNRFKLNGCEFVQTWNGFVYHLTCRGSRFNPNITEVGKNSPEWEEQNIRSTRNFIRKWGAMVRHDEYLHPIIPHKYNIGFVVKNCIPQLLPALEIWCDKIVTDLPYDQISEYISAEQPNTKYRLTERILQSVGSIPDVIVEIDGQRFSQEDYKIICNLSDILTDSGEPGCEFEIGNLRINIKELNHYENNLIVCNNEKIELEKV